MPRMSYALNGGNGVRLAEATVSSAVDKKVSERLPRCGSEAYNPLSKDRRMVNFLVTTAVMFLAAIIMFGLAVAAMP